jgi:MoaA/NifB/PqqE/SkfB family radical SAM enzyme
MYSIVLYKEYMFYLKNIGHANIYKQKQLSIGLVGKAKAAYRVAKGLLIGKLFNKRVPINVMWRVTNRCNAKCTYCQIRKQKKKELSTSQIFKIIDELDSLGCARIGFVGGEAFIREDFGAIVDYVKSKGIYVTLVSNGILVPSNMDIVRKLDCLVLSFDGRKENHEKGRMKGTYNQLMKAFEVCKDNRINVLTNTVLNKHNLDDIDFILDTVNKHGYHCTFNLLQGGDYPKAEDYRRALLKLKKRKMEGAPIVLSENAIQFLHDWPDYEKCMSKDFKGFKCWAGELIFNIDTDGKIAACDIMSHVKKNPSAQSGLKKAIENVSKEGCVACTCAHVIEYNYMFSLSPEVISSWLRVVK